MGWVVFPPDAAYHAFFDANRNLPSIRNVREYEMTLEIGNILLAMGVGWPRVEAGKHFPSDVLADVAPGHFLSAFIHDAFMGLPESDRLGVYVLPSQHGAMVGLPFGF